MWVDRPPEPAPGPGASSSSIRTETRSLSTTTSDGAMPTRTSRPTSRPPRRRDAAVGSRTSIAGGSASPRRPGRRPAGGPVRPTPPQALEAAPGVNRLLDEHERVDVDACGSHRLDADGARGGRRPRLLPDQRAMLRRAPIEIDDPLVDAVHEDPDLATRRGARRDQRDRARRERQARRTPGGLRVASRAAGVGGPACDRNGTDGCLNAAQR